MVGPLRVGIFVAVRVAVDGIKVCVGDAGGSGEENAVAFGSRVGVGAFVVCANGSGANVGGIVGAVTEVGVALHAVKQRIVASTRE